MAKMHSYGVDNQAFRSTILSWMVLATFVTVVLVDSLKKVLADSLKKGSFDFSSLSSFDFSSLETYLPLLSVLLSAGLVPVTFLIMRFVYEQFIWKINPFEKVPNLSGTWIGMGDNPNIEHLRLELMRIEQNWHEILITVEVYEGKNIAPTEASSWLNAVLMGTEQSTIALITECNVGSGDLIFNYQHTPEAKVQDHLFKGTMFLTYKKTPKFELKGHYINSKKGDGFEGLGLVGKVRFLRVSPQLMEAEEALQERTLKNVKDTNVLAYLYERVTD